MSRHWLAMHIFWQVKSILFPVELNSVAFLEASNKICRKLSPDKKWINRLLILSSFSLLLRTTVTPVAPKQMREVFFWMVNQVKNLGPLADKGMVVASDGHSYLSAWWSVWPSVPAYRRPANRLHTSPWMWCPANITHTYCTHICM